MLNIYIKSYDEHFDTFAVIIQDHSSESVFESLIPAAMLPYIAPQLVSELEDLPYDCIGKSFDLHLPKQLFKSECALGFDKNWKKMNMDDRCMFIAHEIGCAMLDDFLQLPSVSFHTNVCEGVDEGIARHDAMFALTH